MIVWLNNSYETGQMSYLLLCLTWCFKKAFQEIGLPLLYIKLVWSDPVNMTRDCRFKRWLMRPRPISETSGKLSKLLNLLMKISLLCNLSTWVSVEMRMSVSFAFMMERGKSDISTRLTTLVSASSWSHLRASSWSSNSEFVCSDVCRVLKHSTDCDGFCLWCILNQICSYEKLDTLLVNSKWEQQFHFFLIWWELSFPVDYFLNSCFLDFFLTSFRFCSSFCISGFPGGLFGWFLAFIYISI